MFTCSSSGSITRTCDRCVCARWCHASGFEQRSPLHEIHHVRLGMAYLVTGIGEQIYPLPAQAPVNVTTCCQRTMRTLLQKLCQLCFEGRPKKQNEDMFKRWTPERARSTHDIGDHLQAANVEQTPYLRRSSRTSSGRSWHSTVSHPSNTAKIMNRGRFPANKPMVQENTPPHQPVASSSAALTNPSKSDSILPPPGYQTPSRTEPPPPSPPPTTRIPDPDAGFPARQSILESYLASLAEQRNIPNPLRRKLIDTAEETIVRQIKNTTWLNPKAEIKISLPSYYDEANAEAQDFLLKKMGYTGWAWRNPNMVPQHWSNGAVVSGPGVAARDMAMRSRYDVSPWEQ